MQDANTYSDSCLAYKGGVCEPYLITGGSTNVTTLRSKTISEQDIIDFFLALDTFTDIVTQECREATKPFICRYVFPLCDDNGNYHFVSKDDCLYLQNDVCVSEWLIALSYAPELVPDCEELSTTLDEDSDQSNDNFEQSNMEMNSSGQENNINCPEDFGLFCDDKCLPLCSQFSQYNEITTATRKNIDIFAAILAVVGGAFSLILIAIRRKTM